MEAPTIGIVIYQDDFQIAVKDLWPDAAIETRELQ